MRGIRRDHNERMKRRAARIWRSWHVRDYMVKSTAGGRTQHYSQQDLLRIFGRQAAMHCTHVCGMCKYEKRMNIPHIASSESIRVYSLEPTLE